MAALARRNSLGVHEVTWWSLFLTALFASGTGCKRATEDHGAPQKPSAVAGEPSAPTMSSECEEDNRQVYVVSTAKDLYRFPPLTKRFTKIGHLDCPSFSGPQSMAVDRRGVAWILYNDGRIYRASTRDAQCTETKFEPVQQGPKSFGMAFVTDGPASTHDTLFLATDEAEPGLATLDLTTLRMSPVVRYQPQGGTVGAYDLTGTGDGRVFGIGPEPARIVELEPKTARILVEKKLIELPDMYAWAIAHYWGSFYVFAAASGNSRVTRFDWSTGQEERIFDDVGFVITGAGVSTCAPTKL